MEPCSTQLGLLARPWCHHERQTRCPGTQGEARSPINVLLAAWSEPGGPAVPSLTEQGMNNRLKLEPAEFCLPNVKLPTSCLCSSCFLGFLPPLRSLSGSAPQNLLRARRTLPVARQNWVRFPAGLRSFWSARQLIYAFIYMEKKRKKAV